MNCPKCGYEQEERLDCKKCGIVFSKYTALHHLDKPQNPEDGSHFQAREAPEDDSDYGLMELRQALREGPDAVKAYATNYGSLPRASGTAATSTNSGWEGKRCVYFDAIEMIEQEVPA